MDVLSDVLRIVRLTGSIFFTADLSHPYAISSPPSDQLLRFMNREGGCVSLFHILKEGECWFKTGKNKAFRLQKGMVVIFPHASAHTMCSSTEVNAQPLLKLMAMKNLETWNNVSYGGDGDLAKFICGYLICDQRFNPLIGAIPDVLILVRGESAHAETMAEDFPELRPFLLSVPPGGWLEITLVQLQEEVDHGAMGSATVITRLTELMFVEVLRRYMKALPDHSRGWLAGIRDPEIGKALEYLHSEPYRKWNVEELAGCVGVSRSSFAQRFGNLIGEPPMHYLTRWRIQLSKQYLLQPELSMAMVAEKVGYESDVAFSRAFRRYEGTPPGTWREKMLMQSG